METQSADVEKVRAQLAKAYDKTPGLTDADNPEDVRSHDNDSTDALIGAWAAAEEKREEDERQALEKARAGRVTAPPKRWGDKAYAARKRKAKAAKASKRRNR